MLTQTDYYNEGAMDLITYDSLREIELSEITNLPFPVCATMKLPLIATESARES